MNKNAGFSLIELMIVVAIIGILAVIGIPYYKTNVIKAKISAALSVAEQYKKTVEEYYFAYRTLPPSNSESLGLGDFDDPSDDVARLTWRINTGAVELWINQLSSDMNSNPLYNQIWIRATVVNDGFVWECGTHNNAQYRIDCKYLPSSCTLNC